MIENHDYGLESSWASSDNRNPVYYDNQHSRGSIIGLFLIMAVILGMCIYIASFYMDREALPGITRKQKPVQSETYNLSTPFVKNLGSLTLPPSSNSLF